MELRQGFDDLSLRSELTNKLGVVVVSLDEVGTTGREARGRLDEVGPQRALAEHDLIRVQVEVFNHLQEIKSNATTTYK